MARYTVSPEVEEPVAGELQRIAELARKPDVEAVFLAKLNAAPAKYKDGMVVYADGTNWNPGGGEGVYCRYGGAWNKL